MSRDYHDYMFFGKREDLRTLYTWLWMLDVTTSFAGGSHNGTYGIVRLVTRTSKELLEHFADMFDVTLTD